MANRIEKDLITLYDTIGLGSCEVCRQCKAENPALFSRAVGAWFVGDRFSEQEKRVLFVGKNARGTPADSYDENQNGKGFLDEFRYSRDCLWSKGWAYWSYTAEISRRLFGSLGMEAVAFTNLIKCNGSDSTDTTTDSMKCHCIKELEVIRKEIEIIQPTHIVFYTGYSYDDWLDDCFDSLTCRKAETIVLGEKRMPYAEYNAVLQGRQIQVLRIGHPERMKKEDYISVVVNWVEGNELEDELKTERVAADRKDWELPEQEPPSLASTRKMWIFVNAAWLVIGGLLYYAYAPMRIAFLGVFLLLLLIGWASWSGKRRKIQQAAEESDACGEFSTEEEQPITADPEKFAEKIKKYTGTCRLLSWILFLLPLLVIIGWTSANQAGTISERGASYATALFLISLFLPSIFRIGYGVFFKIKVEYALDNDEDEKVQRLYDAIELLRSSRRIWQITGETAVSNRKVNAGAVSSLSRRRIGIEKKEPWFLRINMPCYCVNLSNFKEIYILPDKLIVKGKQIKVIDYSELKVSSDWTRFIESGWVPRDAEVVDYAWKFSNVNGGPDRRYNNNYQIPVCRYGELLFEDETGASVRLMLSNYQFVTDFEVRVEEMQE